MGIPGEGVTLGYSTTSGGTYTLVGGILDVELPGGKVEAVDNTVLTSTARSARASLIPDFGEVKFTIKFSPNDTGHVLLRGLLNSGTQKTPYWFKAVYTNDGSATTPANDKFNALLIEMSPPKAEIDKDFEVEITLKIIAVPTYTAGV